MIWSFLFLAVGKRSPVCLDDVCPFCWLLCVQRRGRTGKEKEEEGGKEGERGRRGREGAVL